MTKTTAKDIVAAFDEVLDYVYGRAKGRDNPFKEDLKTAQLWIDEGLTLAVATCVFYDRMSYMQEKFYQRVDLGDKSNIPKSLKIFDENIIMAIRRVASEGQTDTWELEDSRWRARLDYWIKTGKWDENMFGPSPTSPACRAPRRMLAGLSAERKKKEE